MVELGPYPTQTYQVLAEVLPPVKQHLQDIFGVHVSGTVSFASEQKSLP